MTPEQRIAELEKQLAQAQAACSSTKMRLEDTQARLMASLQKADEAAKLQAQCELYLRDLIEIVCFACTNETVLSLQARQTILRISSGRHEAGWSEGQVQAMPIRTEERNSQRPQTTTEASPALAGAEGQEPREVQTIHSELRQEEPGQMETGQDQPRSLQRKVPNGASECGGEGQDTKTEEVPRVRLDGGNSRASQRLQQAINGGLALQYLSRQEAQDIVNRLSQDAGTELIEKLERCEKALDFARTAMESALDSFGHNHWDKEMTHGQNCPKCIDQAKARQQINISRQQIDEALKEGKARCE